MLPAVRPTRRLAEPVRRLDMPSAMPHEEAGAIIAHYFKQIAGRASVRWTQANDRDMQRLGELLGQAYAAGDTITPYCQPDLQKQLPTRVTQVLAGDQADAADLDPQYQAWRQRQRRAAEHDTTVVERMTSRERANGR
jgi:hypothetical protein